MALLDRLLARRRAIVMMMAAALGVLTLVSSAGQSMDRLLRQSRDVVRWHDASGEIHIIEIDARSLAAIDKWPWPRRHHAAAVEALVEAGVEAIAFDVDFSAHSEADDDARFATALKRAGGNVTLPTFRQQATSASSDQIDAIPIKQLRDNAFLAAVTVIPDSDGYVRHMPLGAETKGIARPSMASMLANESAKTGRFYEIDFSIDPMSIPRHSFIDLVRGRIPAEQLAGKRVVIGATAIEMGDRYVVPGHGVIPGVVLQVLAAETLIQGPVPVQLGPVVPLLLALGLTWLCTRGKPRRRRMIVFAGGGFAILLLPAVSEELLAVSFELAPALAALAASAMVAAGAWLVENYREGALRDPATGLPNHAALDCVLSADGVEMIVVARIDRLAAIASGLGPEAAARLVSRVADRLRVANFDRCIYRIDEANLAWIEHPGDEATLEDRLQKIVTVMRSPVDCGRMVDVVLTMGMADEPRSEGGQMVANASLAALQASRNGFRWERFKAVETEQTHWHLSLLGELDTALASGQVWNAYQPKMDLKTGCIVGCEALVRWLHPERGPIAPDDFIPLLEQHGRARDMTLHVLAQALEDALHWEGTGRPIGVAVNVSATLLGDEDFIDQVRLTLKHSLVPAERITIEVTESAGMDREEKAIEALTSWRDLGVRISIDDYGTGQSSLGYLQKLPATELKIDMSFIQTMDEDPRNAIMVRSTIALAHELGMKVVAEGIEDARCLSILTEMGCDTGQGYHIGRPMSASNLSVFLGGTHRQAA